MTGQANGSTTGGAPVISGNTEWNGIPMPKRLWAILAVTFGVSLSVLDGAIANVALPTIGSLLNISPANSIWIVNAYQLAIVVSLLSFSALGDVIGYRKIYIGGLLLFTIASAGCALSDSLATLVAAILAVAPWQWLFAINIPIGITAFFLSRRFLPDNPVKVAGRRFDWRDGAMNALTFGLLIASIEGYAHGIDPRYITTGIILLLIVGTLFVRSQLHKPYPILPFDLLKIPIFSVSVLTSICSFIAQMSAMVALPFYLQHTFGYSAVTTGLVMTAWPAVIVVVAPLAGILVERVHAGLLGGIGLSVMTCGLFLLAWLPPQPHEIDIIWRLVLCGLGFGLFQSPNNSIMVGSAPPHRSGSASGMLATARLLGQTTGAALVALLFHITSTDSIHTALILAGGFAAAGAVISFTRLSLPMPRELRPAKKR